MVSMCSYMVCLKSKNKAPGSTANALAASLLSCVRITTICCSDLEGFLQRKREKRGPTEWSRRANVGCPYLPLKVWIVGPNLRVFGTALASFVLALFQPGLSQIGKL